MKQLEARVHQVSIVCVAAREDSKLLAQWEAHLLPLAQAGVVTIWSALHLQGGVNWRETMSSHLEQADVLVFLLSADFFASDECLTLMGRGLQRQAEGQGRVIPLLTRPVEWKRSPLGMLPSHVTRNENAKQSNKCRG